VPVVSAFFGIVIRFYEEHGVPHFHAEHQGRHGSIALDGTILAGELGSAAALRLVREWAGLHQSELGRNWKKLRNGETPERIAPLD
jgi:hypothetical protein